MADEPLRLSSNQALPPFLGVRGRDAAAGSEGFQETHADNSGVEACEEPDTDADLSNWVAGLERTGLEVHEVSWAKALQRSWVTTWRPPWAVAAGSFWRSVTMERCQFLTQNSSLPDRTSWSPRSHGEQSDWSNGFSQECSACLSAIGLFSVPTYQFAVTPASRGTRGPFVTVVGSMPSPQVASGSEVASSAVCDSSRHDVEGWERLECRSTWTSPIRTADSWTLSTGIWTLLVVSRKEEKLMLLDAPAIWYARSQMGGQRVRTMLVIIKRMYACGFQAGFILYIRWIPSEINFCDEGSRYLDEKFDGGKSLLHQLISAPHLLGSTQGYRRFAVPPLRRT